MQSRCQPGGCGREAEARPAVIGNRLKTGETAATQVTNSMPGFQPAARAARAPAQILHGSARQRRNPRAWFQKAELLLSPGPDDCRLECGREIVVDFDGEVVADECADGIRTEVVGAGR